MYVKHLAQYLAYKCSFKKNCSYLGYELCLSLYDEEIWIER